MASLELTVRELQLEEVHELIRRVVEISGCATCGLLGLDFHIQGPMEGPGPQPWQETPLFREFAGAEMFGDGVEDVQLKGSIVAGR